MFVSLFGLSESVATAEPHVYEEVEAPDRHGLTFGLSIGRGSIEVECGSCARAPKLKEALSVAAHVGYMILPRIAVTAEHWTVRYNERGGRWFDDSQRHLVAQRITAVAAQAFVTDSIWLKAGVGVGWHIGDGDYTKPSPSVEPGPIAVGSAGPKPTDGDDAGLQVRPAYFTAIGWEFARNRSLAAEVQLRVAATQGPDYQVLNTGLNFGMSWY